MMAAPPSVRWKRLAFPPGQARELAAEIREEVAALPPPTAEQRARLRALLDLSGDNRRGTA